MKKIETILLIVGVIAGLGITLIPDIVVYSKGGMFVPVGMNMMAFLIGFAIAFACAIGLAMKARAFDQFILK